MKNTELQSLLDILEETKLAIQDLKGKLYDTLEADDIHTSRLVYNLIIDNEIIEAEIEAELLEKQVLN